MPPFESRMFSKMACGAKLISGLQVSYTFWDQLSTRFRKNLIMKNIFLGHLLKNYG
jgi:hypothetical protein